MSYRIDISNPPITQVNGSDDLYRLEEDLVVRTWDGDTPQCVFAVPAGFQTDGATVPRFLWWLIPKMGRHSRAAFAHDWLYRRAEVPRFFADACFRLFLHGLGVPWYRQLAMYWAVRLFGGCHRRTDEEAP